MSRLSLSPSPTPCGPSGTGAPSSATASGAITPPCAPASYAGSPMDIDPDVLYTPIRRDDSPYSWRRSPGSPVRCPVSPLQDASHAIPPPDTSSPEVKCLVSTPKATPLLDRISPPVPLLAVGHDNVQATQRRARKRQRGKSPVKPKTEVLATPPQRQTPSAMRTVSGRPRPRFAPYARQVPKVTVPKPAAPAPSWIPSSAFGATFDRNHNFRGTTTNVEYRPAPYAPSFTTYERGLPLEYRLSPPHTLPTRPLQGRQVLVGPVLYWSPEAVMPLFRRVGAVETVEPTLGGQFVVVTFVDYYAERAAQLYNNVCIGNGEYLSPEWDCSD